jgi:hypothetical protein
MFREDIHRIVPLACLQPEIFFYEEKKAWITHFYSKKRGEKFS